MFKDSKTGKAEDAKKASSRQLVWNSLIKTLANVDHATICAGISTGDVYGAFMRVVRTKSVQSIEILHTNLFDELCLLVFKKGENFPKFRARAHKLVEKWSDAGMVMYPEVFKVKIERAIEKSGNESLATALEAYVYSRTHTFTTGQEILEKMIWWHNNHKDKSSMQNVKSSHEQDGGTQQVPALGATTVTDGNKKSGKNGKGQSTHFCRAHHIYNNCKYGSKCRFRHDGTPPSSWPKNASEVCPKHPGKAHTWDQCDQNPQKANKSAASPPANAAKQDSGTGKVHGFSYPMPKSKEKDKASIARARTYIAELEQKEKELAISPNRGVQAISPKPRRRLQKRPRWAQRSGGNRISFARACSGAHWLPEYALGVTARPMLFPADPNLCSLGRNLGSERTRFTGIFGGASNSENIYIYFF